MIGKDEEKNIEEANETGVVYTDGENRNMRFRAYNSMKWGIEDYFLYMKSDGYNQNVLPIIGGIAAVGATVGLGAKVYKNNKKNNSFEEDKKDKKK